MAVIKYQSPLGVMNILRKEMDKIFDSAYGGYTDGDQQSIGVQWSPSIDIKEETDKFIIHADLPGIDANDVKISLDNNVLTIKGERTLETQKDTENYHRVERFAGSFSRQFTLPQNIDGSKIEATYKKGVLNISVPKAELDVTKYIEVKALD